MAPPRPLGRTAVRIAVATAFAVVPMAAVLAVGSAAPLAPPLGACTGPDCPATWPAPNNGDFTGRDASINVFTGGDYTVNGRAAEAEGKIVTLGNLTVDKNGGGVYNMGVVGVGTRVVPPNGSDFVTAGGNVDAKRGNSILVGGSDSKGQAFGNVRYAGTLSGTVTVDPTGQAIKDPNAAAPYQAVLTRIEEASDCSGRATATGTVKVTTSEATFTGDGTSARQVFNVSQDLAASNGGQIGLVFAGIPAGATVVVNMLGDNPTVNTYTGTGLAGDRTTELRSKLMWNFPTATNATIKGSAQFQGSIMAGNPGGTTTLAQPGINGRVYLAGNLIHTGTGGYEIHGYPFDGDLPECKTTPSPSPSESSSPSPSPSPSPTSPTHSPSPSPTATSTSPTATPTSTSPSPTPTSTSPSPTASTTSPSPSSTSPSASSSTSRPVPTSSHPTGHESGHHGHGELPSTGTGNAPAVFGAAGAALLALGGLAVRAARRRGRHS
ncbi:choice-of-anchor A family protein [Streptomyces sp. SP17BM10]|uniref:choice-of-anchor A family protein n=1 Tax=Streptomyces sp. SP17BM10 TaxID=3002530 RepID=UPI002E76CD46|nr:choice-of-anchor A family protein [Streptomyces sp. SP17BM10]MEE1787818.1 choice-of-anchor A family protein [Streptomyces sp. SP17BM10]